MTAPKPYNHLPLTVVMITCLILLINTSFKIIALGGMLFTSGSVLCPIVAGIYLIVLKKCTIPQQRQVLNQSLLAIYLFSIGVYLLVNLPSSEYVRDNMAYQIVFENIPKKFFAATLAFGISFYLPHLYCCAQHRKIVASPQKCLLLALFGGFCFFSMDFLLLFSEPTVQGFSHIYIDSLLIAADIMLTVGVCYLAWFLFVKGMASSKRTPAPGYLFSPLYQYLVGFSVIIILVCLACEYRLIAFSNGWSLAASGLFSPLVIMASNLIGELYGYRANLRLMGMMILSELIFDILLMLTIMMPSPDFFDLNPFYLFVMPRRLPATALAIFVTFSVNAMLLEKLKTTGFSRGNRGARIFTANIISISLLCLLNHFLLFAGIYPNEQIFDLTISAWFYKLIVISIALPLFLWLYKALETKLTVNNSLTMNATQCLSQQDVA